jgi:hypothetical protein
MSAVTSIRTAAGTQAAMAPDRPNPQTWSPLGYHERGPISILTEITPELAARMLECNTHNRTVTDSHVRNLSADMAAGRWVVTHQGIAYDANGTLVDGQHRLWACIESKTTIRMMVSYNVDPDSLKVIDTGKGRTVGQTWDLLQPDTRSGRLIVSRASVIRQLLHRQPGGNRFLYADAEAVFGEHKAGILWSCRLLTGNRGTDQASVAGALAYCYPTAPDRMDLFATQIRTGEMISRTDPAYALRRVIEETGAGRDDRWVAALATVRAAYAHAKGSQLSTIKRGMLVSPSADKAATIDDALDFFDRAHTPKPTNAPTIAKGVKRRAPK